MGETNRYSQNCEGMYNVSTNGGNSTVNTPSFRNAEPVTMSPAPSAPTVPPRPEMSLPQNYAMNSVSPYGMGGLGSYGLSGMGSYGAGGMGSYGMGGMGTYGIGGVGSYGMGGMGSYGMGYGYNTMGQPMYGEIENRFIQMAEESARPTFESIQSLVHAVGSIAVMMDNTFCAFTSSFRAILGVAENFGRLRTLFAQIWSTFAVLRTLNWMFRKLMVMMGIRTESEFKAWADAVAATQSNNATPEQQSRASGWPVLLFFGVVAAAPYIVLRMFNGLTSQLNMKLDDPTTWKDTIRAVGQYDFNAATPQEMSFRAHQVLTVAPQQLQGTLWNSGWLMATKDKQTAGLVPVTYIKLVRESEGGSPAREAPVGQNAERPAEARQ